MWPAFVAANIPANIGDHSDVSELVTSTIQPYNARIVLGIDKQCQYEYTEYCEMWSHRIINAPHEYPRFTQIQCSTLKWNEHNGQWSMIINKIYIFRKWHIRFGFVVIFRSWHTHTHFIPVEFSYWKDEARTHSQIDVRIRITMVGLGRRNENKNHFNHSHINSCIWFCDALPFCRSLCFSILSIAISKLYSSSITVKFTMKNSNKLHRKCKQINRTFHKAKCSPPSRGPSSHSHLVRAWGSEGTLQCLPNSWRTHTWLSTQWITCDHVVFSSLTIPWPFRFRFQWSIYRSCRTRRLNFVSFCAE